MLHSFLLDRKRCFCNVVQKDLTIDIKVCVRVVAPVFAVVVFLKCCIILYSILFYSIILLTTPCSIAVVHVMHVGPLFTLITSNKKFDMIIVPNGGFSCTNYMFRRGWDYFVTHLLGAKPPKEFNLPEVSMGSATVE